jgi:Glutathione-dependent formaldehyde-activating enzyme
MWKHTVQTERSDLGVLSLPLHAMPKAVLVRLWPIHAGAAGGCRGHRRNGALQALLGDFCPDCGVRLIHRRDAYGTEASLKAGSLDDTSWLVPAGHIWTRSKQKWVTIPRDSLAYEAQPEDFGPLKERWREMIA